MKKINTDDLKIVKVNRRCRPAPSFDYYIDCTYQYKKMISKVELDWWDGKFVHHLPPSGGRDFKWDFDAIRYHIVEHILLKEDEMDEWSSAEGDIMNFIEAKAEKLSDEATDNLLSEVQVNIELWLHGLRGTKPDVISFEEAQKLERKYLLSVLKHMPKEERLALYNEYIEEKKNAE